MGCLALQLLGRNLENRDRLRLAAPSLIMAARERFKSLPNVIKAANAAESTLRGEENVCGERGSIDLNGGLENEGSGGREGKVDAASIIVAPVEAPLEATLEAPLQPRGPRSGIPRMYR